LQVTTGLSGLFESCMERNIKAYAQVDLAGQIANNFLGYNCFLGGYCYNNPEICLDYENSPLLTLNYQNTTKRH